MNSFFLSLLMDTKITIFLFQLSLTSRGRIYRAGLLHFHERDLARSLITFATESIGPIHLICLV